MTNLPTWVRARSQYHSSVWRIAPNQDTKTPLRELLVYEFYSQAGTPLPLFDACQALNKSYYGDWGKVRVDDVSKLVPKTGWRWNDGKKPRKDKLGCAEWGANLHLHGRSIKGVGKLDYGGAGGALRLGSGSSLVSCTVADCAAAGVYIDGQGVSIVDSKFHANLRETSDQGQIYIAGRGQGGHVLISGVEITDDPSIPKPLAWNGVEGWRRYGIHVDDGASDVWIVNCLLQGLNGGICVNGGTNVHIVDSRILGCDQEIDFGGRGTLTIAGTLFDNSKAPQRLRRSDNPNVVLL